MRTQSKGNGSVLKTSTTNISKPWNLDLNHSGSQVRSKTVIFTLEITALRRLTLMKIQSKNKR